MEIIHLILGKANPDRMNGVNRVVHELAGRQCGAGKQVEVWGITKVPVHNYPARNYTTRLFARPANPFCLHPALQAAIQSRQHAVFHLHGGFVPQMYMAARLLKRHGIPFVFTPHGSYNTLAMHKSRWQKKLYFQWFESRLLQAAKAVHLLGKSEMDGLQEVFPNSKSVLIPYGYDLECLPLIGPVTGQFIIGYCGRIDIYTKGLKELLEGFAAFAVTHPGARLWMIGDGAERNRLTSIAAMLGITDKVVFWGAVYGKDKNNLLQQCQVFAAPSRNEGLPTAVLEAASLGIPCMVTEATNTGNYIRQFEAGIVIQDTCGEQIQNALTQLYQRMREPEAVAAFCHNARRMVAEAFNWEKIVMDFNALYQC
ncbi:Glycosyltransferase involved in cell wall bisynthesis [Filimonas lacunae]|uniref:Glycosyltransferase involved in cell wall bisynthesis n=1 Tax=Filimonas lacunae TaxID=477680 RepID=A0A173MHC3_9BACT|nr:glycosyltransferase [Filimonas lacunae]BAV06889.1 glycosyltransferase [Filimonas lacunae]SIS98311.1 Glycosyltransferase involved in cell wall bisynthesis [Filimonas lacunae]